MAKEVAFVRFTDGTILIGCYWTINCEVNYGLISYDTLINDYNGSLAKFDFGNMAEETRKTGKTAEQIANQLLSVDQRHIGEIVEVHADDSTWLAIANKEHKILLYNRCPFRKELQLNVMGNDDWAERFMKEHPSSDDTHYLWR
ncbi:MAG: hypothetical protein NC548_62925 [Lachnospiraceae bacterium]|nr:hypothetical protein [Lachnospiraceae bacterium]